MTEEFVKCDKCPLAKTCIVYITAIKTVQSMKAQLVDELQILEDVNWTPEDLALHCKYKPIKMDAFGV